MPDRVALEPAPGLSVAWKLGDDPGAEGPPWSLDGSLAPSHSALRVLTGRTEGGRTLLLAAARPAAADGHDAEAISATVLGPGDERTEIGEVLLSTEYDGAGAVRRVTLELGLEGEDYPMRGAGDARATASEERDGLAIDTAELDFRLDGEPGTATYSIARG